MHPFPWHPFQMLLVCPPQSTAGSKMRADRKLDLKPTPRISFEGRSRPCVRAFRRSGACAIQRGEPRLAIGNWLPATRGQPEIFRNWCRRRIIHSGQRRDGCKFCLLAFGDRQQRRPRHLDALPAPFRCQLQFVWTQKQRVGPGIDLDFTSQWLVEFRHVVLLWRREAHGHVSRQCLRKRMAAFSSRRGCATSSDGTRRCRSPLCQPVTTCGHT